MCVDFKIFQQHGKGTLWSITEKKTVSSMDVYPVPAQWFVHVNSKLRTSRMQVCRCTLRRVVSRLIFGISISCRNAVLPHASWIRLHAAQQPWRKRPRFKQRGKVSLLGAAAAWFRSGPVCWRSHRSDTRRSRLALPVFQLSRQSVFWLLHARWQLLTM